MWFEYWIFLLPVMFRRPGNNRDHPGGDLMLLQRFAMLQRQQQNQQQQGEGPGGGMRRRLLFAGEGNMGDGPLGREPGLGLLQPSADRSERINVDGNSLV